MLQGVSLKLLRVLSMTERLLLLVLLLLLSVLNASMCLQLETQREDLKIESRRWGERRKNRARQRRKLLSKHSKRAGDIHRKRMEEGKNKANR